MGGELRRHRHAAARRGARLGCPPDGSRFDDGQRTERRHRTACLQPRGHNRGAASKPRTAVALDGGFRVFKVDTTNMSDVLRTPDALAQDQLELYADSVKPDRTGEDLLFQVLLDWGLELTMSISG